MAIKTNPTEVSRPSRWQIFENKCVIWDLEIEMLRKIIHDIQGLLPLYENDIERIRQIKDVCDKLVYERIDILGTYVYMWQEKNIKPEISKKGDGKTVKNDNN